MTVKLRPLGEGSLRAIDVTAAATNLTNGREIRKLQPLENIGQKGV